MEQVKKRRWPIALGIIAAIIVVAIIGVQVNTSAAAQETYEVYTVEAGEITKSVTNSGTLQAQDDIEIDLPIEIDLDKTLVNVGDPVTTGQTLATLDTDSLDRYYKELLRRMDGIDYELMTTEKETETVKAPLQGRVKQILVEEGDDISDYEYVMLLSTDGKMKIDISTAKEFDLIDEFKVKYGDGKEKTGRILAKTGDGYTITVSDDGPKLDGEADVYFDGELVGSGVFEVNAPIKVIAKSGIVKELNVEENDSVSAGGTLVTLENKITTDGYQDKYDERTDIEDKIAEVREYLSNPIITAPTDGIVRATEDESATSQQSSSGSTMPSAAPVGGADAAALAQMQQSGAAGTPTAATATASTEERTVFELSTGGMTELTIEVDEMDIALVTAGQEAIVTVDALGSEQFAAKVDHISRLGNAANGVTSYDVVLKLDKNDDRLFEGMNASVTIVAEQIEDAVLIPLELVQEDKDGTFVEVSPSGSSDGLDRQRVEIIEGVSDGINVQIQSGLEAGDKIVYINESSGSNMIDMLQNGGIFASAS